MTVSFRVVCDMCGNQITIDEWEESDQILLSTAGDEDFTFCGWPCLGEFTLLTLREQEQEQQKEEKPKKSSLKPVRRTEGQVEQEDTRDYREEDAARIGMPQGVRIDDIRIQR